MEEDVEYVRRLKQGDIGGLEGLVVRYQAKATRTAFLILRDSQLAEDITQETFLKIFRHIRCFDEQRSFEPYLMRSIVNAALDSAKRYPAESLLPEEPEIAERLLEQAATPEALNEHNWLKQELDQALAALSPRQRAAIVLRYYLGMNEKDMAEKLDAAPGTIKWLLNTARGRMRSLLNERMEK